MVLFGTPAGSAGELPFVRFAAFFRKLYRVVAHGEYPAIGVEFVYVYATGWRLDKPMTHLRRACT